MAIYHVTLFSNSIYGILKRSVGFSFIAPPDSSIPQLHSMALKQAADVPVTWHVGVVEALDYEGHVANTHFAFLHDDPDNQI